MTTTDPESSDRTAADATAVLPSSGAAAPPDTPDTPPERSRGHRARRFAIEWVLLIVAAIGIALLIKAFLFDAFYIPSQSMEPTLYEGDRILVNKLSYDFGDVDRGDVIVFEAPECVQRDGIEDFVKRVVGLPGETVTFQDGSVFVDGHRIDEPYLRASSSQTDPLGAASDCGPLPDTTDAAGVDGADVPAFCGAPANGEDGCVVPKDRVFVLGDNRTASQDGRYFGAIEESAIIGRVFLRIWPPGDIGFF